MRSEPTASGWPPLEAEPGPAPHPYAAMVGSPQAHQSAPAQTEPRPAGARAPARAHSCSPRGVLTICLAAPAALVFASGAARPRRHRPRPGVAGPEQTPAAAAEQHPATARRRPARAEPDSPRRPGHAGRSDAAAGRRRRRRHPPAPRGLGQRRRVDLRVDPRRQLAERLSLLAQLDHRRGRRHGHLDEQRQRPEGHDVSGSGASGQARCTTARAIRTRSPAPAPSATSARSTRS